MLTKNTKSSIRAIGEEPINGEISYVLEWDNNPFPSYLKICYYQNEDSI